MRDDPKLAATDPAGEQARRPLVLFAVAMAMFMAAVESTIVATAMPTIVAALGGFELFSWVFAIYLLAQAITIPIYGRLADLLGRKRVLFAGAGLFLLGSALCGLAGGMPALIAFRALQGAGAGAIMPIATTIVGDIYPPAERPRVQGKLGAVWGVSAILGPLLGAFIIEHVGWSVIFWVNLPIGVLAIGLLGVFFDERIERRRHRIDYGGALLLMLGSGLGMLGLIQSQSLGLPLAASLIAAAGIAIAAFLAHEGRAAEPILPLGLWRQRVVAVGNLGGLLIGCVMMGVTAFLPTFVQGVLGRSPLIAGFALTSMSLGWSSSSALAGHLMVRASYRATAVLGGLALVLGSAILISLGAGDTVLVAGAGALVIGIGMGCCNTTYVVAVQSSVAWSERGIATSLALFMRMVGQSLGAALFGAMLNFGLAGDPEAAEAVDRLLEPVLRQGLASADVAHLTTLVGAALHGVYLLAGAISLLALALTFFLPRGLGPLQQKG